MSSWDQAKRGEKLGLVWRNRKKISQIINDYLYLPFYLFIILWSFYTGGHTHTGQWRQGTRDGPGRLEYPDGSVAEGEWRAGRRHGWFLRQGADGRTRRLRYIDGHLERCC
jgi:hypothetical protein